MKSKIDQLSSVITAAQIRTGRDRPGNPIDLDHGVRVESLSSDDRRSFLGLVTGLIGLSISGLLAVTLGRFAILPALSASGAPEWIEVGPLAAIPEGRPTNRSVVVSQYAGWGRFSSEQSLWVVKKGERVTVFTSVCPHLGCTINEKANGFGCVCHNSAWSAEGEKLAGPTPRGMDVLEHQVKDGILKVKYQNFKQGVAEKQAAS